MSLYNPNELMQTMKEVNKSLGHFNVIVSKLTAVIDRNVRAQTKVVAAASKTHGIMMGVVADLDLLGGAFGRVKRFLGNLFLPLEKDAKKSEKAMKGMMQWGMHPLKTIYQGVKKHYPYFKQWVRTQGIQWKAGKEQAHIQKVLNELLYDTTIGSYDLVDVWESFRPRMKFIKNLYESPYQVAKGRKPSAPTVSGFAGYEARRKEYGKGPFPTFAAPAKPAPTTIEPWAAADWDKIAGHTTHVMESLGKGMKDMKKFATTKFQKSAQYFNKEVMLPLAQIAAGGIGLGFQTRIIMGMMQAFSALFNIFSPIIDVITILMERLSVGFMPLIEILMDILTSEPVLAMIDLLSEALAKVFEMFKPLVPIIIKLIGIALKPLQTIISGIMPLIEILAQLFATVMEALMPLIELIFEALAPVIVFLTKVLVLLLVLGMYPLVGAIYVIGLGIAALMDLFTLFTEDYIGQWNRLILPIFDALNVATGQIIATFQYGGMMPYTGLAWLERGERVLSPEETKAYERREFGGGGALTINVEGGIWVEDLDDFVTTIMRKSSLYRG